MALAIVVLTAAVGSVATAARDAVPSADSKKRCKIVKKKVHGKVRKVRVCTTVKPTIKNVSVKLETDRSVSKPIAAADGGTLTATSSSGAKLTLTIPKDALVAGKTVTMTPVASLAGLPKGLRFLGGVQLAPEGTALAKDATLTIETPAAASAKHVHAVAWDGTGKNPFTYAATRTGSTVRVKVIHFSGYAAEDGEQGWATVALNWLQLNYHQVRDLMTQATTTDSVALGRAALERWLEWERQAELLGGDNFMKNQRRELREELLPKVMKNMIEKSYDRCRTRHDVADELLFLTSAQRQAQLLGLDDLSGLAEEKQRKCASFELDFESVITWVANGHVTSHVRVQALKLNASNNLTNDAPIEYLHFEFLPEAEGNGCTIETSTQPAEPFGATIVSLQGGHDPPGEGGSPPKLVMNIFIGGATETIISVCPDEPTLTLPLGHWWQYGLTALHQGQSFTIGDWDYVGTSLFARKTYSRTAAVQDGQVTEQTTFDLRHTPE
jgi:hypothetical protein